MAENTPLSQHEFDLWREGDTTFKTAILKHIETQVELNRESEGRLVALETNQLRAGTLASWISAVIAAIVGSLAGAFWSK